MTKIQRQALSIYQLPIADGQEFYIEYSKTVLDTYDNEALKVDIYKYENTSSSITAYLAKVKVLDHIKKDEVYKATIQRRYTASNRFSCQGILSLTLDEERTAKNKKKRSSWLKRNAGLSVPIDNFGRNQNTGVENENNRQKFFKSGNEE